MSIVSETLKKLEEKRSLHKKTVDNKPRAKKKSNLLKPLLAVFSGAAVFIVIIIFFLNKYSLKSELETDRNGSPLTEAVEKLVIQPVEKPVRPAEEPVRPVEEPATEESVSEQEAKEQGTVHTAKKDTGKEIDMPPRLEVSGVIVGQKDSYAIINGEFIRAGEEIEGAKIISIRNNKVTYTYNGRKYTIRIQ